MGLNLSQLQEIFSSVITDVFHLRTTGGFDKKITLPNLRSSIFQNLNKGLISVTISNYDNALATVVKVGSVFDNAGITINVETSDKTPTGYGTISNSTEFYLYWDESASIFIYSETVPTWSDIYQGWYNVDDRALFSMYKDSGGTLYQNKVLLLTQNNLEVGGYLSYKSKRVTSENYVHSVSISQDTVFGKLDPFIPDTGDEMAIHGSLSNGGDVMTINRVKRATGTTMQFFGAYPHTSTFSAITITDGVGTGLEMSASW